MRAAAEAGLDTGGDEHRWEAPGAADARAMDLVYDPATRMFWRNVRARVRQELNSPVWLAKHDLI